MKILLTGRNGQIGWELNRSLIPLGEVIALDRKEADFSNPEELRTIVRDIKPDVIVNAAAYTAVDKAESEEELATLVNGVAPGILAEEAKKIGALLIHYSTDYVFDGTKDKPYVEDDIPRPINAYGRSKLAGERAIQSVEADYLILRTSWIYAARGHNFLQTIIRLAQEQDELSVVSDQIGTPTWARLVAETTACCLHKSATGKGKRTFESGVYHLTSSGETSWFGFAQAIVEKWRRQKPEEFVKCDINPTRTIHYPTPAKRPMNSRLDSGRLEKRFEVVMPIWMNAIDLCLQEIV